MFELYYWSDLQSMLYLDSVAADPVLAYCHLPSGMSFMVDFWSYFIHRNTFRMFLADCFCCGNMVFCRVRQ